MLRRALDAMCRKLDGAPAAAKTARRKRAALNEVLNTAVEKGYFVKNPLNGIRWNAPAVNEEVGPGRRPEPRPGRPTARGGRPAARARPAPGGVLRLHVLRGHAARGSHPPPARTVPPARDRMGHAQPVPRGCHLGNGMDGRRRSARSALTQTPRGQRDPARAHPAPVRTHPPRSHRTLRGQSGRPGVPERGRQLCGPRGIRHDLGAGPRIRPDPDRVRLWTCQAALRPPARRDLVLAVLRRGPCRMRSPRGPEHPVLFRHYAKFLDGVQEQSNRLIEQSMQEWDRISNGSPPVG